MRVDKVTSLYLKSVSKWKFSSQIVGNTQALKSDRWATRSAVESLISPKRHELIEELLITRYI